MLKYKAHIVAGLQTEILRLQGFKTAQNTSLDLSLGPLTSAFPNNVFPLGCIHEFIATRKEDHASTSGFIGGLMNSIMDSNGAALWISTSRTIFPPALKNFNLQPDRLIFVDLKKEKDVLWVMEEALKCGALSIVIAELKNIGFTESRRLQVAVEKSQVTGFIIHHTSKPGTTACVSRWKVSPMSSEPIDDLPGVGYPRWHVDLLRMRNGKPGSWNIQWQSGKFYWSETWKSIQKEETRKVG